MEAKEERYLDDTGTPKLERQVAGASRRPNLVAMMKKSQLGMAHRRDQGEDGVESFLGLGGGSAPVHELSQPDMDLRADKPVVRPSELGWQDSVLGRQEPTPQGRGE